MSHWAQVRRYQSERWASWRRRANLWTAQDEAVREAVQAAGQDVDALSRVTLAYFWAGQEHYLDAHGTLADYPGWPSCYGARNDAIEGVTRLMPLWAAAQASALTGEVEREAMGRALQRAWRHGCDPRHPGYWGAIGPRSTLICEAADVALAAWLARDGAWCGLSETERAHVLTWLAAAIDPPTADNNWHLFAVLVDAACAALDSGHRFRSTERLARVWQFALGDGCFRDGPQGQVDLYNAWAFHYLLFWLRRIAPQLGDERSRQHLLDYLRWYRWLFTPSGVPLWGRSLGYRLAVSLPLQMAALDSLADPGEALAAYLYTWRYFIARGALRAGRPTQGVFGEDQRWLDPYSGPASSFWGTRSLLLHLVGDGCWTQAGELPASRQAVELRIEALPATLSVSDGVSSLHFDGEERSGGLAPWPWRERLRGLVYGVSTRPANNLLRLGQRRFDSTLSLYAGR